MPPLLQLDACIPIALIIIKYVPSIFVSCWVLGLTVSSHETLLSCRRPVTLGLHSVALPLEHVRLSGICWILIQMVEWTRLVASLCSFRRLLLFLLHNWVVFFVDCCVVVSFRSSGGLQMWLQFPKVPYRRLSATIGRFRLHQFCQRFLKGWSLCVLVVFWRDLGSCLLTSTHTGIDWVPVMLFLTSSVLVSWN